MENDDLTIIYSDELKPYINKKTGQRESWGERLTRIRLEKEMAKQAEIEANRKAGKIEPNTQKEHREAKRKQRQAEAERAKLTQQNILDRCNTDGHCEVTVSDMKNAFPALISQIDGNAFRTQIDSKTFNEFLSGNGLIFVFPDFVFLKRT
jgi:hypothetical protein